MIDYIKKFQMYPRTRDLLQIAFSATSMLSFGLVGYASPALSLEMEVAFDEPIFVRVQTHDIPAPACLTIDELIEFELAIRSRDPVRIGNSLTHSDCLLLSASSHGKAMTASAYGYAWIDFDHAQPVDAITFQPVPGSAGPAGYWVPGAYLVDMFSSAPMGPAIKAALGG